MFGNRSGYTGGLTGYAVDAPVRQEMMGQPGQFAGAFANTFGTLGQGLTGLGQSAANAYGVYGAGLGNVAQAMANERSNRYAADSAAEVARQMSVGNIGAAGLGAYGSAANSALGAWAANQTAYNQAAGNMHSANQNSLAAYGVGRDSALGQSAMAAAQLGTGLGNASRVDSRYANMGSGYGGGGGGGGFNAYGPGGAVASGSFSGGMGGMGRGGMSVSGGSSSGPGPDFGGIVRSGFGSLDSAIRGITSSDVGNRISSEASAGRRQLDDQHYSSRGMPSQMLGQALEGLQALTGQNLSATSRGMDQYYASANDPRNRADFSGVLSQLGRGFDTTSGTLRDMRGDLNTGYGTANQNIGGVWNSSLGPLFEQMTPVGQVRQRDAANQLEAQIAARDRAARQAEEAARAERVRQQRQQFYDSYDPAVARERARLQAQIQRMRGYGGTSDRDAMRAADRGSREVELYRQLYALPTSSFNPHQRLPPEIRR